MEIGLGLIGSCSKEQQKIYKDGFTLVGSDGDDRITGNEGAKFFAMSKLSRPELKQVWAIADSKRQGFLGFTEFVTAMQLISFAQEHELNTDILKYEVDWENISPPVIEGLDASRWRMPVLGYSGPLSEIPTELEGGNGGNSVLVIRMVMRIQFSLMVKMVLVIQIGRMVQMVKMMLVLMVLVPGDGENDASSDGSSGHLPLEELHRQLHANQTEKSDRLKQIQAHLGTLNSLCLVLGLVFKQTISEVHPSLDNTEGCKNISLDTIERLAAAIKKLRDVKLQRMHRLQDLATTMLELWNLMDTPIEEQQMFQNITCNISASEHEITEPDTLSVDFINYVEAEVSRLEELKSSKMKELVLKKRTELEEICRKTHMVLEADSAIEYAIEAIESGVVDPSCVLDQIELQVAKVKEEAFSRKDILERVEKWLFACDEECWLEEYNRDENRYNAGRGAHLTLKRAEKARALVNKLPAMVDALASKTIAWEKERGIEFTYDGVRLLSMLEEYTILRDEKEQERRRQRDQKKIQGQLIAEQEALYGSKPSPSKPQSVKKAPRISTGGASNRRLSMQAPKADSLHSAKVPATPLSRPNSRKSDRAHQNEQLNNHHDDGFTALSTGRRALDRNHSFGSNYEPESPMMRKPFAPISLPAENGTFTTPLKSTNVQEEDNTKTPKVILTFVPTTPHTVSVPMQTAVTPAPPPPPPIPFAANVVEEVVPEEIEYSFEEIRAGFVLPEAHTKSMIQV